MDKDFTNIDILIWISPELIKYTTPGSPIKKNKSPFAVGIIKDGDWDLCKKKLADYDYFYSSRERYISGVEWNKTDFYIRVSQQIESGQKKFGCDNIEEWNLRLEQDDILYDKIRRYGYKSQKELKTYRPWDEVRVSISRNGDLLFFDGRHRLAMAQILGVEKIPVIVTYIHKDWYIQKSSYKTYNET